jgi:hypothetical protein
MGYHLRMTHDHGKHEGNVLILGAGRWEWLTRPAQRLRVVTPQNPTVTTNDDPDRCGRVLIAPLGPARPCRPAGRRKARKTPPANLHSIGNYGKGSTLFCFGTRACSRFRARPVH